VPAVCPLLREPLRDAPSPVCEEMRVADPPDVDCPLLAPGESDPVCDCEPVRLSCCEASDPEVEAEISVPLALIDDDSEPTPLENPLPVGTVFWPLTEDPELLNDPPEVTALVPEIADCPDVAPD
jgi:hypothetical protein